MSVFCPKYNKIFFFKKSNKKIYGKCLHFNHKPKTLLSATKNVFSREEYTTSTHLRKILNLLFMGATIKSTN